MDECGGSLCLERYHKGPKMRVGGAYALTLITRDQGCSPLDLKLFRGDNIPLFHEEK